MATTKRSAARPILDARPDTLDFRDLMFTPTLVEVPLQLPLAKYLEYDVPILDQGAEGACTGFGLATVANFLLRARGPAKSADCASPHMFYNLAKRYDEWPGEQYSGSSARGAMKGWHKHGACADKVWPKDRSGVTDAQWATRWTDARKRPLGAYFRVNHRDLVALHAALAEVGILYATAVVHSGWDRVGSDGIIPWERRQLGGHAFAIVGFEERGFWIQNSWGTGWGRKGYGLVAYSDWLQNGTDVWVARLGAPVQLAVDGTTTTAIASSSGGSRAYVFDRLRPHIVSLGNDGELRTSGPYGTGPADVEEIVTRDFPRVTEGWPTRNLLLYAHGGLVSEDSAVQRVADYLDPLLAARVYPLSFIWKTDYWTTITDILQDALHRRRPEGFLDAAKDFMLDRLDDALEPLARVFSGKAAWDEMKENARLASSSAGGGAALTVRHIRELLAGGGPKPPRIHLVGHSAGSIFLAYLVPLLTAPLDGGTEGPVIETCTLWAPACTLKLFRELYAPAIDQGRIRRFTVFTLTDAAERDDDCADIYHKSLLYLVSNAFEEKWRVPVVVGDSSGEPLLGMEKALERDAVIRRLLKAKRFEWVRSPNAEALGSADAARSAHHGAFDDDEATVRATLARVLGRDQAARPITFGRTGAGKRSARERLMRAAQRA
ncbi:MAG TPA: C1 family peptidase [Gemmatimonadales bacterium]|nr:C1 family peptidase [Gemmatimonadales bacterium]